jgi:anti-sigma B factor antagonist
MAERHYPVHGDIDLESSTGLQAKLLALVNATKDDLVVDCRDLEFIDSSGIAVLVHTQRLLEIDGRGFRLENVGGMAKRAIELLGLQDILGIAATDPA